jgi:acetyl-CoA C-acetyltransferase
LSVWILGAQRTPIGRFGGALARYTAVQLGTQVAAATLERAGVTPDQIDLTVVGLARQAGCGPNPGRQISIRAGVPDSSPAYTLNQACASGLSAIQAAARHITVGEAECVLVVGAESMSNVPYLAPGVRWGARLGHKPLLDAMYQDGLHCPLCERIMGETVESLAEELGIARAEQDAYALRSQQRAQQAWQSGAFRAEVVPVEGLETDEHPRFDSTPESLAKLPAVFSKSGSITAGNSSGITDGAAALVLAGDDFVQRHKLPVLARYLGGTVVGLQPERMGLGPIGALRKYHERQKDRPEDYAWVEINEAFAAQVLACQAELKLAEDRLNPHGGAIALGHPIGCSGARVAVTLLHGLRQRGGGKGVASLCVSGGMGIAAGFEVSH